MAERADKTLQLEATVVSLQRQVDEMKSNAIRVANELRSDLIRIQDEIDSKDHLNINRIKHLEAKTDQQHHMNGEKIHLLQVDQAKVVQAVQFGGYFIKFIWGICGTVLGSMLTALALRLIQSP